MVAAFPAPVLSVAADVLKDLDGGDALGGLWTLFTKCKESLQDGRRLENISWRLWYRELASQHPVQPSPPADRTPTVFSQHAAPLTPESENGEGTRFDASVSAFPVKPLASHRAGSEPAKPSPAASGASPASRPSSVRTKSCSSVGKIICDMIPEKLALGTVRPPPPHPPAVATQPAAATPFVAAPLPSVLLPPPSTPPSASNPRVVVVNPTPHPTPPTTPTPLAAPALPPAGQHLLPPPRLSLAARDPAPPAPLPISRVTAPAPAASLLARRADDAGAGAGKPQRFFLPQDQSPSPERDRDSQDRGSPSQASESTGKTPSDVHPSSVASNQTKASNTSSRREGPATSRGRKAKESAQKPPVRPGMHRPNGKLVQRKSASGAEPLKGRATFKVGSDGKAPAAGTSRTSRPAVEAMTATEPARPAKDVVPPPPKPGEPAARRGIVLARHSSSEYETTTDTDEDDSWSDEGSAGDGEETRRPSKEEMRIREAAVEAQRQRELFTKQPKRSYSNLNRTQSGLLTALLNPDPNLLPQNHPYRSNSTADLARLQHHRGASSATPAPQPLTSSKSSAALPTTAQVNAQAPRTNGDNGTRGGGYRPKGRPQGEDMEDDSDSGDENPDDTIQVSHSLAQQKLAALADPNRRRNSDRGQAPAPREVLPTLPTVATAPIPLNHPWNLPAPAAPSTPRTTRRQMLATELSESLRRNLLWERQVSKTSMMGPTAQYRRGSGLLGNGLRPLTSTTQAQGTQQAQGQSGQVRERERRAGGSERGGDSRSGDEADDKDERKRRAMARNRSWADDYHYSGW